MAGRSTIRLKSVSKGAAREAGTWRPRVLERWSGQQAMRGASCGVGRMPPKDEDCTNAPAGCAVRSGALCWLSTSFNLSAQTSAALRSPLLETTRPGQGLDGEGGAHADPGLDKALLVDLGARQRCPWTPFLPSSDRSTATKSDVVATRASWTFQRRTACQSREASRPMTLAATSLGLCERIGPPNNRHAHSGFSRSSPWTVDSDLATLQIAASPLAPRGRLLKASHR